MRRDVEWSAIWIFEIDAKSDAKSGGQPNPRHHLN